MALMFRSKAGADILMLQAHAEPVLRALGRDAQAQGIFLPEQIAQALAAFALAEPSVPLPDGDPHGELNLDGEPPPGLAQRAWPLLQMLRRAQALGHDVTWSLA